MERTKKDTVEELKAIQQYFEANANGAYPICIAEAVQELNLHPQGQWNKINECNSFVNFKCSKCFRTISVHNPEKSITNMSIEDQLAFYPFCHCGADMRNSIKREPSLIIVPREEGTKP